MTTPKMKEGKDTKGIARKGSVSEEPSVKEMLKEIIKELQTVKENQEAHQETTKEQTKSLKEIKEEMKGMKVEIALLQREIKTLKNERTEMQKTQESLERKIKILNLEKEKAEEKQLQTETKEMEYQLRLRNIQEEQGENIREKVKEILGELMERTKQEIEDQTDRIFRINTNYAIRNRTARDVIVHFVKKTQRDEVLKINSRRTVFYKGKKVIILKEIPGIILNRRKKYSSLVEELKRQKIRFRWERGEGLMATYQEKKYWITNEEVAKDFLGRIIREKGKKPETEREGEKERKRARTESPEKENLDAKNYRMDISKGHDTTNLNKVEEEIEEETEEKEEEEEEEGSKGEEEEEKKEEGEN
ncbi:uncharacterized protein PF3D7_1120000-like [Anolis sagrei]|uniref:uncharacterized protein PF3D7_1120000-like n=1 Tax=Anolis sagrei TaxID=38937 RepID=UPI003522485E